MSHELTTNREDVTPGRLNAWRDCFYHLQKWAVDFKSDTDYEGTDRDRVDTWNEANALSSEIVRWPLHKGEHCILLDIDQEAFLFPSGTHGHHHLYIEAMLPWRKYRVLLWVLQWCGVIERGYYKAAVRRKATFLRTPDKKKVTT